MTLAIFLANLPVFFTGIFKITQNLLKKHFPFDFNSNNEFFFKVLLISDKNKNYMGQFKDLRIYFH